MILKSSTRSNAGRTLFSTRLDVTLSVREYGEKGSIVIDHDAASTTRATACLIWPARHEHVIDQVGACAAVDIYAIRNLRP